jgi:hypothetical protein
MRLLSFIPSDPNRLEKRRMALISLTAPEALSAKLYRYGLS